MPAPKALLADKGYDGDSFRESLLLHGLLPIIPPKSNRKNPPPCDFKRYKDRNRVERMFGRLKDCRRLATRYDKLAINFLGNIHLAAAITWWLWVLAQKIIEIVKKC